MNYWDSSALVALHVRQDRTAAVRGIYSRDSDVVTWVLSDVEVRSALNRLGRDGVLKERVVQGLIEQVEEFWESVSLVSMVEPVRARAKRLLGIHSIRAADALQLAAALAVVYDDPRNQGFVCLDDRLAAAARREGFAVLPG